MLSPRGPEVLLCFVMLATLQSTARMLAELAEVRVLPLASSSSLAVVGVGWSVSALQLSLSRRIPIHHRQLWVSMWVRGAFFSFPMSSTATANDAAGSLFACTAGRYPAVAASWLVEDMTLSLLVADKCAMPCNHSTPVGRWAVGEY